MSVAMQIFGQVIPIEPTSTTVQHCDQYDVNKVTLLVGMCTPRNESWGVMMNVIGR
jgi:hypothetical protein